jgi:DNA-binding protein HU-beta
MIKTELVDAVASRAQLTKKEANQVVEAVLQSITEALSRGEKVQLVGFGTFEVRQREARSGRNPQTGEAINIPARRAPVFKPGKLLKEAVE